MAKATPAADANLYRACSVAAREFFLLERGGGTETDWRRFFVDPSEVNDRQLFAITEYPLRASSNIGWGVSEGGSSLGEGVIPGEPPLRVPPLCMFI